MDLYEVSLSMSLFGFGMRTTSICVVLCWCLEQFSKRAYVF